MSELTREEILHHKDILRFEQFTGGYIPDGDTDKLCDMALRAEVAETKLAKSKQILEAAEESIRLVHDQMNNRQLYSGHEDWKISFANMKEVYKQILKFLTTTEKEKING